VRDEWVRTVRTAVQVTVSLALAAPVLVPALGLSMTTGVGVTLLAIASTVTRLSQVPQVALLLNKYLKIPLP
jgi:hypothetical protein